MIVDVVRSHGTPVTERCRMDRGFAADKEGGQQ